MFLNLSRSFANNENAICLKICKRIKSKLTFTVCNREFKSIVIFSIVAIVSQLLYTQLT